MTDMGEMNKLLKRVFKNTYKKLNVPNLPIKKASNTTKILKKVDKTVKFADKSQNDSKDSNKTSKSKTVKANNKKNTTSNTVSEIQTSDSDQDSEIEENRGWNNLPDMVMTSDNSDASDTYRQND